MPTPDEHAAEALAAMGTAANMIDVPERALVYAQMATTYALLASRPVDGVGLLDVQAQNMRELRAESERLREELGRFRHVASRLTSEARAFASYHLVAGIWPMGPFKNALADMQSLLANESEDVPVPYTGEDQAAPDSARARAGMTVVHKSGSRHVLSHRKGDDSGWWLADKGGVADWILDSDDWQLIFEPVPDEGSETE